MNNNQLAEAAKSTGITTEMLRSLDYETQQTIVYEFMMDSSQIARKTQQHYCNCNLFRQIALLFSFFLCSVAAQLHCLHAGWKISYILGMNLFMRSA